MTQLNLLAEVQRVDKPWRRVRATSVAQYGHLRDSGQLAHRRACVLRAVAALRNARQEWPTSDEVLAWLLERREVPDGNVNHVRPRLTELAETGVVVRGPKRKSRMTGINCITWEVRSR